VSGGSGWANENCSNWTITQTQSTTPLVRDTGSNQEISTQRSESFLSRTMAPLRVERTKSGTGRRRLVRCRGERVEFVKLGQPVELGSNVRVATPCPLDSDHPAQQRHSPRNHYEWRELAQ